MNNDKIRAELIKGEESGVAGDGQGLTDLIKKSARKLSLQNKLMKKALNDIAKPFYSDSPQYAEYDWDHAKDEGLREQAKIAQGALDKLAELKK